MSENSSNDQLNSSENEEESKQDFRVSAVVLRNDIKRRVHNGIEKRRKDKINYWIHKLAELLPFKEPKRESKTHLLENIYQYINQLKEKNDSLMFGSLTTNNTIHVEEIRRLNKRCKELEEKTISYYRLLEMAGISPSSWPQDIHFERPTKYSKKISEQQLSEFLAKNSDKKSDKNKDNGKRNNESDENSGQLSNKRLKSSKRRSKNRKDRERERNLKCSPPTPVLPKTTEQLSLVTNTTVTSGQSVTTGQTAAPGSIVLLNDHNFNGVEETPKFIVNTNNGFNGLNTFQFRPAVGPQPLQFLSGTQTIDSLNTNTNLLSGQLLLNLNPPAPPPQPTAVLLPNGQIVQLITQPQPPPPQPIILAPNQSFVLTTPNKVQPQQTIISGQTKTTICANIKSNNNLTQIPKQIQNIKQVSEEKKKKLTTTIETIVCSQKPINKKNIKSIKKQLFSPKASKNSKKDKRKQDINSDEEEEKSTKSEITVGKTAKNESMTKNSKTSDKSVEKSVINSKDKTKIKSSSKSSSCDKSSNEKKNENIVNSVKNINKNCKSKPVLTAMSETPDKKMKESSNCSDILAKATQSIFSPQPPINTSAKHHQTNGGSNKKEVSLNSNNKSKDNNKWSGSQRKDITINDNNIKTSNKCKNSEFDSNKVKSESVIKSNQIEVISEYCANSGSGGADSSANTSHGATSANITNKANLELINDTNKNDNYVHNRTTGSEENSKIEKTIASGNKAEINKKSVNTLNNSNAIPSSSGGPTTSVSSARNTTSVENKLSNVSTLERSTLQSNSCQSNASHQLFTHQTIATNNGSDNNRLSFGFGSQQNQTNSNSISNDNNTNTENQTIDNESELPSILLSLNDANEVSAESVHSVSNSSLPAFLSLSPEHLNEYLPKDNITNSTDTENANRDHTLSSDANTVEFSPHTSVEQHPPIRAQENSNRLHLSKEQQNYSQYPKSNESSSVVNTSSESRSSYTSNFPTISSLITNDYSDFSLTPNKSMFGSNNSTNYFENFNPNPLMNPKMSSQNNNFLQFPLQNDNSFPPLYPMHSYPIHNYLQNNTNSNTTHNANRDHNSNRNTFFAPNESQPSVGNNTTPKGSQNHNQSHSQSRSQTTAMTPQQSKTTPTPPQSTQTQPPVQSNTVMPMRSQRNASTEQQIPPPQRHPQQPPQHTSPVASNSNSTNKTNSNSSSVQYSTHNSFSSYSAEALIRQNEPTVQQIQSNEQNRYNTSGSAAPRITQQSHTSANLPFTNERNSSRASISYSAESLIQSNPMNNSNQMSNKSTQREVENESINGVNDNRISYYQHIGHNNTSNASNNLVQRTEQNNSNNLFNFDNSLNSRIMSSTSTSISQNCGNNYPQITFNSHLPDIRTSTATTSSESLFPITSNATTVNTNSNRTLSSNSISNNNNSNTSSINSNNNNNQISHTVSNMGGVQQHSPVIYPSNNNQNSNSQQSKRSANNSFNSGVNAFIHSNADNYLNASHSTMYSTSGPPLVDPNLNPHPNQYQRSSRNSDLRFGNCLQPTNQNSSSSVTQHNNSNTGCLFNAAPNTTYFPTSSGTPFPPLLPSAPSPFDPTTPFSTAHRPPMFPNTFMPDFNTSFNTGANTPLPHLTGSNFNINPSVTNNNNNSSNSTNKRETHPTNTRSSSNLSRSPNQSKHSKLSANSNTSNTKTKKQNNSKQNESSNNTSSRHSNDNCFSMNDLMSSTTPTNQSHNRYSNFVANTPSHNQSRQPVPSPTVSSSHSTNTNNKNVTSSADTSSSYPLFRPQSQNVNNSSNVSNSANFSVNSLQNSNRSAPPPPTTSAQPHFGSSSGAHHSSHATNFHLSNIFPDINSNNSESLAISPMKFAPPVTPVVPPPVGQSMDANAYPNHHSSGHHQNLYHSHHSSARISTPHNAFNSFLSSGAPTTHNTNNHPFDPQITPNNRTVASTHMSAIGANSTHSSSSLGTTHPHSHHSYTVPSFNF